MVKAHFFTPVGEFVAVFDNMEEAKDDIGSQILFEDINSDILIIPAELQKNSAIILREE